MAIEQSRLWEISQQLVGFNTVSSLSNVQACEYLGNLLEEIGFNVQLHHEIVHDVPKATVLAWAGPAVTNGLIISGHTDIVPFDGQPGWHTDALTLSKDDERIYGRGTSDMKVFLAQAILAAQTQRLADLKRPLLFIFTCDEEVAGQGSGRLIKVLPELLTDIPLPEIALIGEPTNFDIHPAHKGFATFDVLIHGKGGHSSLPHKGVNAIAKMGEVIQVLQDIDQNLQLHITEENKTLFPEYPASSVNYGVINGGLAANMIADACRMTVSFRITPGDNIEEIMRTLQTNISNTILPSMRNISQDCTITIADLIAVPPMRSPSNTSFTNLLSTVMNKPVQRGVAFATDGGQFQQAGIHSYICGPGLIGEAHQPNESIPLTNFMTGQEKLEEIIHKWCIG